MTEGRPSKTLVTGVDFLAVPARDFARVGGFLRQRAEVGVRQALGGDARGRIPGRNVTIAIMEPTAFGQKFRPHALPIALQVDDVPQARRQLQARGLQFVTDLIDRGVCHRTIFLDPAGSSLGIHRRYAPPAPG